MDDLPRENAPRSPAAPPPKKAEKPPAPPPATKCADCGKKFTGRSQTRWDVHLGGGAYATVCTTCFEKRDSRWPIPSEKSRPSS